MANHQKRIAQVDADTGEQLEGATLALYYPKRKNGFKQWTATNMDAFTRLATLPLGLQDLRVFFAVAARIDFENLIHLNQTEIAAQINMRPTNVGRSLRTLENMGIIEKGPKVSGHNTYRMNPEILWRGSAKNHHKALSDRMKAARMSVAHDATNAQTTNTR